MTQGNERCHVEQMQKRPGQSRPVRILRPCTVSQDLDLDGDNTWVMSLMIPCIVVDAPLFLANFDYTKNDFVLTRVPSGRICWNGCHGGTMVDIVHIDRIDEYVAKVKKTFDLVIQFMME